MNVNKEWRFSFGETEEEMNDDDPHIHKEHKKVTQKENEEETRAIYGADKLWLTRQSALK